VLKRFSASIKSVAARGWWNDADGWSLADVVVVVVLPIWMYVAIKLALANELSGNQVDFFLVVSYPLLIAVGGKSLGYLPLPWSRRSNISPAEQIPYNNYYCQQPVAGESVEEVPASADNRGGPQI